MQNLPEDNPRLRVGTVVKRDWPVIQDEESPRSLSQTTRGERVSYGGRGNLHRSLTVLPRCARIEAYFPRGILKRRSERRLRERA